MTYLIDAQKVSSCIKECSDRIVLPLFKNLQASHIMTKSGPTDLVTIADQQNEAALRAALLALYPQALIVGEEGTFGQSDDLSVLSDPDALIFVIDPVDGTHNFAHGNPDFCVMVAGVERGMVTHAFLYDVLKKEMTTAERGAGAWCEGRRLRTAGHVPVGEASGYIGLQFLKPVLRESLRHKIPLIGGYSSLRCSGQEYMRIADGGAHFSLYSHLKPWDHLAGSLLVHEAGGRMGLIDGTPYVPAATNGLGLLSASHPDLWTELQRDLDLVNLFTRAFPDRMRPLSP